MALIYHHTAIHTKDIAASVEWYVENLQAKILKQHEDWAMLMIDQLTLALTLPDAHPAHIAFEVDSLDKFPCYKIISILSYLVLSTCSPALRFASKPCSGEKILTN